MYHKIDKPTFKDIIDATLLKDVKVTSTIVISFVFWIVFAATSDLSRNAGLFQLGNSYAPVVSFHNLDVPPKMGRHPAEQLVWKHERHAILLLPFYGSKSGQYGLYRTEYRRFRSWRRLYGYFLPLSFEQAQKYAAMVNVRLSRSFPVTYWSLSFGWLVILPFALVLVWDKNFYRKLYNFFLGHLHF